MQLTCDACGTRYNVDPVRLGQKTTAVKCARCGHLFVVIPPIKNSEEPELATPALSEPILPTEEASPEVTQPSQQAQEPGIRREYLPVPIARQRKVPPRLGWGRAFVYGVVATILLVFGYQYVVSGLPGVMHTVEEMRSLFVQGPTTQLHNLTAQRLRHNDGGEILVLRGRSSIAGTVPASYQVLAKATFYDQGGLVVAVVKGGSYQLLSDEEIIKAPRAILQELPIGLLQQGHAGSFMFIVPAPPSGANEFSVTTEPVLH